MLAKMTDMKFPTLNIQIFGKTKTDVPASFWEHCDNNRQLTLKQMDTFFQNVILLSNIVPHHCNISVCNWPSMVD